MKGHCSFLAVFALLALASILVTSAYDPSPLQDICVTINDPKTGIFVNGKFCKDPKFVTADDFLFSELNIPRDTSNPVGSVVTPKSEKGREKAVTRFGQELIGQQRRRAEKASINQSPLKNERRIKDVFVFGKKKNGRC
ncbi:hypothetical protein J1N35_023050 [Gossypium stocksii]|uniref:Cupin type-1 domain-containing protein n=1 Tax=Gossypium stocksii TaxID=47602 RepID=A0A9D4A433_9ROSI|nr:hypothetical protein J1N35_023050 [Gossypium stocksii]